ncbi:MAG: helix-turn-helix domain-containing protein [Streptosporangiaceae bacterium]
MDRGRVPPARVLLDLLDQEAPAVDFEAPLLLARAAGAAPEELAATDADRLVALRIRAKLEQRQRREAELAALLETASDLAALHDLDLVLQAIVRRARLLLGTDVSYMTLNDPPVGDTYMRVTAGSVSPFFQRLRLGIGEGLGGLVAQQAIPYTSGSYLTDQRFLHTGVIDRGVREEGLVGILGVPLLLRDRVIGVLFAADRRPRVFAPAEVSLLSSLAAHAAIAIDGANLLEESRRMVAELNAANGLISEHSAAVERAAQAHQRFTQLVLAGGSVQDVAQAVASVLGGEVVVLGEQDTVLAASGDSLSADDPALRRTLTESRAGGRAVCGGGLWAAPAVAASEHLGTLVLRASPDMQDTDLLILERAATVTALLLLLRRSVTEAEHRVRGELLSDLLSGPRRDPDLLRARARRLGASLDEPVVVVVTDTDTVAGSRLRSAAAHLAATRCGLAAEHDGVLVIVLPETDPAAAARDAAAALGTAAGRKVTAGSAPAEGGPDAIHAGYLQARRCAEALRVLGRTGESATVADLGFLGLLLADRKDVPGFVGTVAGCLIDYDARNGTDLVRTVETYFLTGCSPTETSRRLHVHVNTVTQRLDRVTRLLGESWQAGERALDIHLALRLHRLGAERWSH